MAPFSPLYHLKTLTLGTYVASLPCLTILLSITSWRLYHNLWDVLGLCLAAFLLLVALLPLPLCTGAFAEWFVKLTCGHAKEYFPITMIVEDEEGLKQGKPYMIGLEPHSVLPLVLPICFATDSTHLPKGLQGSTHGVASSVCFKVPFVRQLWWWLGIRPAKKGVIARLLEEGKSVVVVPGGVQECTYMDHTSETLYLRKRLGFVRMAMKHGADLVPVFAFGQSQTYNWWRPGPAALIRWISRQIGVVPLLMWGRWGTPLPIPHPMHVVIGKPIQVPHVTEPSKEEVSYQLSRFIDAMEVMIQRHKKACGCEDMQVHIM